MSKTAIREDIKFDDYLKTLRTNSLVKKDVVSIRSMNHQLYTLNQPKIALTSFYDNALCYMKWIVFHLDMLAIQIFQK